MKILCEDCNEKFRTYADWITHLISPSHHTFTKSAVDAWTKELNECTVVVTGFPQPNSNSRDGSSSSRHGILCAEDVLWFYSSFGMVSNFFGQENMRYCLVQFDSNNSIKWISEQNHKIHDTTVVTRLKTSVSNAELKRMESNPAKQLNADNMKGATATATSKGKISNGGKKKKDEQPKMTPFERRHVEITTTAINKHFDFDEQLAYFVNSVTLTNSDMDIRHKFIHELKTLLTREFPHCEVYPFGSFITGLGDKDSDIDIYVNLFGHATNPDFNADDTCPPQESKRHAFAATKTVLFRARRIYRQVVPIPKARVPILKITHASGLQCDLSFENLLSFQNSSLIAFYQTLDVRARYLIVLVRYWARFHDLSGSVQIKNYALILMVLVYLTRSRIVPSVYTLQTIIAQPQNEAKLGDKTKEKITKVGGWNAGFNDNYNLVKTYMNEHGLGGPKIETSQKTKLPTTRTILALMTEFFEMFAQFDYNNMMICALTGEFLPKSKFNPGYESDLAPELDLYKDWTCGQEYGNRLDIKSLFCLQDPFQLNFNVGGCASQLIIDDFKWCCTDTVQRIRLLLNGPFPALLNILVQRENSKKEKLTKRQKRALRLEAHAANGKKTIDSNGLKETVPAPSTSTLDPEQSSSKADNSAITPTPQLVNEETVSVYFSPEPRFNVHNIFKKYKSCTNWDDITEFNSKVYSLWSIFVGEFFENVFTRGYEMRILRNDKTTGIEESPSSIPFDDFLNVISGEPSSNLGITFMDLGTESNSSKPRQKRQLSNSPPVKDEKPDERCSGTTNDNDTTSNNAWPKATKLAKTEVSSVTQMSSPVHNTYDFSSDTKEANFEGTIAAAKANIPDRSQNDDRSLHCLIEALKIVPSLQQYSTSIKLFVEGKTTFAVNFSKISKDRQNYSEIKPLPVEDPLIVEGRISRAVLDTAGRARKNEFQFEAIGTIGMESKDGEVLPLQIPVFIIKLPGKKNLQFCTDFFRSRLATLLPLYLDFRFTEWVESAISAALGKQLKK